MFDLSEQEQLRRESLAELRRLGINPYPAAKYPVTHSTADLHNDFDNLQNKKSDVCIAGRIMTRRIMGNASFFEIQDEKGRMQVYVRRDDLCPGDDKTLYNTVFKKLLDIGDIVGIKGYLFKTQMGEESVFAQELTLLAKSLRPLPIVKEKDGQVFDAFSDPEQRYRQRYVDLVVNPHVRDVFIKRTKIINTLRDFFNSKGYLEVETPILQPIPGGAAARPFVTHHNALDMPLYLRIANELYLKRLIVAGFDGVYEFSRDFRNEGMDRTHNPEFTVMEIYVAYKDYFWMMEFTEEMIERVALALHGTTKVALGDKEIDFKRPYRRITMTDAIREYAGVDISGKSEEELRTIWSNPLTRKTLLARLSDAGYGKEEFFTLQKLIDAEKSDLFDVLEYVSFAIRPITREVRVASSQSAIFALLDNKQKEFLEYVLSKYIESGVEELDQEKLPLLLQNKYQSLGDAIDILGDVTKISSLFIEFQKYLYLEGVA